MALFRIPVSPGVPGGLMRRRIPAGGPLAVEVRDGGRTASFRHPFTQVYALRWAPRTGTVLLCGTTQTDAVASEQELGRGARRLYRGDLDLQGWVEVGHEWYDDPVELADGVLAAATQNGLRFLGPDGEALRNQMNGRFSWGAPGLSSSPAGTRLAYVRWRGDDQRLCVTTLDGSIAREHALSVFRYCWWDEDTIASYLGAELVLLDVPSGRTRPAWDGLLASPSDAALEAVLGPVRDRAGQVWLGELLAHDERLWVSAWVLSGGDDPVGLASVVVSLDRQGHARLEVELEPDAAVEDLDVLPGGAVALRLARHRGIEVVERVEQVVGPEPDWWAQGWRPLRDGTRPELGFRVGAFA